MLITYTCCDVPEVRHVPRKLPWKSTIRANAITLKQKVPFFTDPTTQSRAQLFTLELDRGLDWPKALAELQAANAREAAAGNTDTINGFYQSRYDGEMGRRHQHLIIRKQYQTGAALSNKFYEMYRVLRPNKGLVAFEQRGTRTAAGSRRASTTSTTCHPSAGARR